MAAFQMMQCGPCAEPTPHRYSGDLWRCMECERVQQATTITALAVEVERHAVSFGPGGRATYPADVETLLRKAGVLP